MDITYYGHSCFGAEINGKHLVFDPFITPNEFAKNIDINKVKADYILISHGHEDHIADAVKLAQITGATIVSNYEITVWLNKQGVEKTHPMNIGGKWMFDFGKVKCVAAQHSSSMPDGSYGGSAMGFLLETSEGDFYYSGDTALMLDMKLIGDYRKINFAMLPIGDNFTMSIENAIIASEFIKCNTIIGMHYDTFGYIKIDKESAVTKFEQAGKKLLLMEIGETIKI
ncbi:MAG: metal-dependent hydrolase [Bacteroidetes bacterium]|nr:metal-dependent hydrolase [Bacteroidota bacterium]HET6244376.1 metal-dependent hydrolase [Bacteroidia bacterium]